MFEDNTNNPSISRNDLTVRPHNKKLDLRGQGIQVESKNFTSAFAGLKLSCSLNIDRRMLPPEKPQQGSPRCPCGCLEHSSISIGGFRTRELSSMRLVVHGPEILNYQGTKQAPEDVAPYWKKDSRMWLWKSVRLARRGKFKPKSSSTLLKRSSV